MTSYTTVKRTTKAAAAGIESAIDLLKADVLSGEFEQRDGAWVWLYNAGDEDCDAEDRGNYTDVIILRNGSSFVAIPADYLDEGAEFTATNGDKVLLVDGSSDYAGIVA